MSGDTNGVERINRNEFEQACGEMVTNIVELQDAFNELRRATNTQAEVLGCHRYILEKFVPLPLLESAAKEYYDQRQREIATATTPPGNA